MSCTCCYSFPTTSQQGGRAPCNFVSAPPQVLWSPLESPSLSLGEGSSLNVPRGVSGRVLSFLHFSSPFFISSATLGIRARALQHQEPQCSGDVEARSSCMLKPAEAQGEIYAGMPGCPMDPEGREYSWLGTRNWEVRPWGACAFSRAAGVSPHLPPQTSSLSRTHTGERGHSTPVLKNSSVCPASKLLCALIPVSRREAGWPSQARCPPLFPAVRGQGWGGVGTALLGAGRSRKGRMDR